MRIGDGKMTLEKRLPLPVGLLQTHDIRVGLEKEFRHLPRVWPAPVDVIGHHPQRRLGGHKIGLRQRAASGGEYGNERYDYQILFHRAE